MTTPPRCGRPRTSDGLPCTKPLASTIALDPQEWEAPACSWHLTAEEKAEQGAALAREREFKFSIQRQEPACWYWPIPLARPFKDWRDADEALHNYQALRGCAICGSPGETVIDHDHATGLVRGNLCLSCNALEGKGASRPAFVKYRERNPASMLGIELMYANPTPGFALDPDRSRERKAAIDTLSLPRPEDLQKETTDGCP